MKCPRCGALNPEHAEWCSQCYLDLRPPEPVTTAPTTPLPEPPTAPVADLVDVSRGPSAPDASSPAIAADIATDITTDAEAQPLASTGGRYRQVGDDIEWICPTCESWNPVGLPACSVCATPFGIAVGSVDAVAPKPTINSSVALVASAVMPGAGHFLAGRRAAGILRAVTFLLWLAGGTVLLRAALASDQPILPALPLLLGALIVWLTSAYDAVMIVEDRGVEVMQPRAFFWLVIGVVGTLMLSFTVSISRLSPSTDPPGAPGVDMPVTDPP